MTAKSSATRTTPLDLLVGVEIVFLVAIDALDRVWLRGDRRVLTLADIESTKDRYANSWLSDLDDEAAQIQKYGQVAYARAEALPEPPTPWQGRSDPLFAEMREAARKAAWAVTDPQERREALDAVERVYGPPLATSTTLSEIHSERRDPLAWH